MKGNIVLKFGGSLLFTENKEINDKKVMDFCRIFKNRKADYNKLIIICGGGRIARDYIKAVRKFTENEALCDIFGIELSRVNAKLMISAFQDYTYPQVIKTIEELSKALLFNKPIIMGGLQPGQSTTSVALEVAEFVKADQLVILTDVDGIYDKDPKKNKDAELQQNLNYEQFQEIIIGSSGNKQAAAGEYRIFDMVSLQILKRSKIKVLVMSGENLENFGNYWNEEKNIIGTIISAK